MCVCVFMVKLQEYVYCKHECIVNMYVCSFISSEMGLVLFGMAASVTGLLSVGRNKAWIPSVIVDH